MPQRTFLGERDVQEWSCSSDRFRVDLWAGSECARPKPTRLQPVKRSMAKHFLLRMPAPESVYLQ
jgi:hypothetical protein